MTNTTANDQIRNAIIISANNKRQQQHRNAVMSEFCRILLSKILFFLFVVFLFFTFLPIILQSIIRSNTFMYDFTAHCAQFSYVFVVIPFECKYLLLHTKTPNNLNSNCINFTGSEFVFVFMRNRNGHSIDKLHNLTIKL